VSVLIVVVILYDHIKGSFPEPMRMAVLILFSRKVNVHHLALCCRHDYLERKIMERKQQAAEKAQKKAQLVCIFIFLCICVHSECFVSC